ncbi:ZIP family metal transporter [Hymenobacter coalescens]
MVFPTWLLAGFWGLVSGSALLLGAAVGYFVHVPQRLIAAIMAFGSGVLISTLSLELMEDAYARGGFNATGLGFVGGAGAYTLANWLLARYGAKHRKRSGHHQAQERQQVQAGTTEGNAAGDDNGMALAVGALLDGIPESIVIGLSMLAGGAVSTVAVAAIFLSNLPEGLSSAAGMKKAGRSARYVLLLWGGIALVSGLSAWLGYAVFSQFSANVVAATTAVAAGAVLAMIADTMIPEAFDVAHNFTGLITVLGFLAAFYLSKLDQDDPNAPTVIEHVRPVQPVDR